MKDYFPQIFEYLMNIEGVYSNDPDDPGGETRWGISSVAFPDANIRTREDAKEFYRINFWEKYKCDQIKSIILAAEIFVAVVNVNAVKVIGYLQTACNNLGASLEVDGLIGPKTISFLNSFKHPKAIVSGLEGEMYKHYVEQGKKKYISGWLIRNDGDFEA